MPGYTIFGDINRFKEHDPGSSKSERRSNSDQNLSKWSSVSIRPLR